MEGTKATKERVNVTLDSALMKRARNAGVNVSRACEDGVRRELLVVERRKRLELAERLEAESLRRSFVEMNPGRNDPCPCGSGRKFKVCCLRKPQD